MSEITLNDDERQQCEVWTRVMGYHRPVDSFNIGKKAEFMERKYMSWKEKSVMKEELTLKKAS